jgi:hypothetical protein
MMNVARDLWMRIETLHAVTYFGDESQQAAAAIGVPGFWLGYFGMRAAPMGVVGAGVVEATFFNFAPSFVRRWVPEVWNVAAPDAFLAARAEGAAATLRRVGAAFEDATVVNTHLQAAVDRCVAAGRPLFAANREVTLPDDPVAALWQLCTSLREHRGDGHVAALTAAGVDGLEAHVLITLETGGDPVDLQRTRGWSADDWGDAVQRLRGRELVSVSGQLTDAGRQLRLDIETTTDQLSFEPWRCLADAEVGHLVQSLSPAAATVSASGVIRYPNPIGLPPLA